MSKTTTTTTTTTTTISISVPVGSAVYALEPFSRLMTTKMHPYDAFMVGRLFARLSSHPDVVSANLVRLDLFRKYGSETADRRGITVPPDKMPLLNADFAAIAEKQITLSGVAKLSLSILSRISGSNENLITPADMVNLEPFFATEETADSETPAPAPALALVPPAPASTSL